MESINRRDFIKTSAGILVVGGAVASVRADTVKEIIRKNQDCDVVELWHIEGLVDHCRKDEEVRVLVSECSGPHPVLHLNRISGPWPYVEVLMGPKKSEIVRFDRATFDEPVKPFDLVRAALTYEHKYKCFRYNGWPVYKGILGVVKVTNRQLDPKSRVLASVSYETYQHSVNDFARDALDRHPDAISIELKWPCQESWCCRWDKTTDGWYSQDRLTTKDQST